jgi:hypothetical protein
MGWTSLIKDRQKVQMQWNYFSAECAGAHLKSQYLGADGRGITWAQELETSLGNTARPGVKRKIVL